MEEITSQTKAKPRWRGVSHQYGCFISMAFALWLIVEAPTDMVRGIAAIYGGSLVALLGVSALYHRINWNPTLRQWMRRLDHIMIFVLIAGSYTPVCTLVLEGDLGKTTLMIVWGAVVFGAIYKLLWLNGPKWIMAALCVLVGWVAVVTVGELYVTASEIHTKHREALKYLIMHSLTQNGIAVILVVNVTYFTLQMKLSGFDILIISAIVLLVGVFSAWFLVEVVA